MHQRKYTFIHEPLTHQIRGTAVQRIYKFENGYGASVIIGPYTYGGSQGLYELAVTHGPADHVCYMTPITDDVVGYLSEDGVQSYLDKIMELPPNPTCTHDILDQLPRTLRQEYKELELESE